MSYDDEYNEEAPRDRRGAYGIAGAVIGALLAAVTTFVVITIGSNSNQTQTGGKPAPTEVINYNG